MNQQPIIRFVKKRGRATYACLFVCVAFLLVALPMVGLSLPDFRLNQFFIYRNTGHVSFDEALFHLRSTFSLGYQRVFGATPDNAIAYSNPKVFFEYLFKRLPSYAFVYPTETYYYYQAAMADGVTLAGNLRLLDADEGIFHIGYFDKNDPQSPKSQFWVGDFGPSEGVAIKKLSEHSYDVSYKGKTVRFALSAIANVPPRNIVLEEDESFIAHILDESAVRFFLVYNTSTKSFYYLLDEENGANEKLLAVAGDYLIGERTRFVYYDDSVSGRKILVGVAREEIKGNTYYDGPFDQVPPRLPLKQKLEAAYPYVTYRGGIDEHGNFIATPGSRVAISPYTDYEDLAILIPHLERCKNIKNKSMRWSCFAYEWKKDFHRTLEQ